jgi:hypothetical protein
MQKKAAILPWAMRPHQKAVVEVAMEAFGKGWIITVKSKRQVGKTTLAEDLLLRYAFNFHTVRSSTLSVLVEPTLGQARRVYKDLVKVCEGAPFLKRNNDSLLEIEFVNGSSILFKSAEQKDSLRGFTVTGILIIDECAFIQDEIYDILQPSTDVFSAPKLLISTPKLKQGFFYRYYQAGLDGTTPNIISVDFNNYDTSEFLPKDKLEQYRRMMPKAQFTTEYLGEFLDSDSILFENIKGCIAPASTDWQEVYVGIDWGTGAGGDYTSIGAFDEKGRMVFIDYFNDKSTFEQVRYICGLLSPYKQAIRCIQPESNSIGTPMTDMLVDELNKQGLHNLVRTVSPFTTTNNEKARLVAQLQVALEQNLITIIDDAGLLAQLTAYEATYNPRTGVVSYNAPQGLHDDNCISTMLAFDALQGSQKRGLYNISFSHTRTRR